MKKSITLIFILTVYQVNAQFKTQYFDITWGEETREEKYSLVGDVIAKTDDGYFLSKSVYKVLNRKSTVVKFNNELEKLGTLELDDVIKGGKSMPLSEFYFNKKLYSLQFGKIAGENMLVAQEIDQNALMLTGERIELLNIGKLKAVHFMPSVEVNQSNNEQYIVISAITHELIKNKTINMSVLDRSMKVLWNKQMLLDDPNYESTINSVEVLDNGAVTILMKGEAKKKSELKSNGPKFDLIMVSNDGVKTESYTMESKDKFFLELDLAVDADNNLYNVGLYSNIYKGNMAGMYFSKVDPAKGLVAEYMEEFEKDAFIEEELADDREDRKDKKADMKYDMSTYFHNGNLTIIAEGILVGTVVMPAGTTGGASVSNSYTFGNISIVNVDVIGKINWTQRIFKRQITSNDQGYFSSYTPAFHGDQVFIIYNDDKRNFDSTNPNKIHKYSSADKNNAIVTLVVLDQDGSQKKVPLFDTKYLDYAVIPNSCEQINENEILIFSHWKKNQRLGKAVIKDEKGSL